MSHSEPSQQMLAWKDKARGTSRSTALAVSRPKSEVERHRQGFGVNSAERCGGRFSVSDGGRCPPVGRNWLVWAGRGGLGQANLWYTEGDAGFPRPKWGAELAGVKLQALPVQGAKSVLGSLHVVSSHLRDCPRNSESPSPSLRVTAQLPNSTASAERA